MSYIFYSFLAIGLSLAITPLIRSIAKRFRILDVPTSPRKIHKQPMPLLGGLSIFLSFSACLAVYLFYGNINFSIVPLKFFAAILIGALTLILGGILDDKFDLPPKIQWLFPALASIIVVWSGIGVGIKEISNPFGNPISLNFSVLGIPFSAIFIWLWMMGMIFTTKILDGLDGLVAGITLIGGLTLFTLSLTQRINQPITATLAIILCGALAGYLVYAFHPASIFLGEGGSTLCGFFLGVLSVILGGKIATALLVMGIPILDVAWVIVRRVWYGKSPFSGDRKHLHHRLLDIGFSHKGAVLILYSITAIFGFAAVFLQSFGKLIALSMLFFVMIFLAIATVMVYKRQHPHLPTTNGIDDR